MTIVCLLLLGVNDDFAMEIWAISSLCAASSLSKHRRSAVLTVQLMLTLSEIISAILHLCSICPLLELFLFCIVSFVCCIFNNLQTFEKYATWSLTNSKRFYEHVATNAFFWYAGNKNNYELYKVIAMTNGEIWILWNKLPVVHHTSKGS